MKKIKYYPAIARIGGPYGFYAKVVIKRILKNRECIVTIVDSPVGCAAEIGLNDTIVHISDIARFSQKVWEYIRDRMIAVKCFRGEAEEAFDQHRYDWKDERAGM